MRGMEDLGAWVRRLGALIGKYKFVFLVILVGIVLLLLPSAKREQPQEERSAAAQPDQFQVEAMEQKLENALSQVDGAGQVTVVLTVRSSARQVLAQDGKTTEKDGNLDSSLTTVVVSRGSGSEETVPLQQLSPQYQGALVVCSGGGDPAVRLRLVEAVSALTGLGSDKISVCKGK